MIDERGPWLPEEGRYKNLKQGQYKRQPWTCTAFGHDFGDPRLPPFTGPLIWIKCRRCGYQRKNAGIIESVYTVEDSSMKGECMKKTYQVIATNLSDAVSQIAELEESFDILETRVERALGGDRVVFSLTIETRETPKAPADTTSQELDNPPEQVPAEAPVDPEPAPLEETTVPVEQPVETPPTE